MPMTPDSITPEVESFIAEKLGISEAPRFIEVKTDPDAKPYSCVSAVENYINKNQGEMVLGWYISVWPHILIEAHLHAVWKSPSGEYLDVSSHENEETRVLFVADARLTKHSREKPVLRGLANDPELHRYIAALQAFYDYDISHTVTTVKDGKAAHNMVTDDPYKIHELEGKVWAAKAQLEKAESQIVKRAENRLRRKARDASAQE